VKQTTASLSHTVADFASHYNFKVDVMPASTFGDEILKIVSRALFTGSSSNVTSEGCAAITGGYSGCNGGLLLFYTYEYSQSRRRPLISTNLKSELHVEDSGKSGCEQIR